MEVPVGVGRRKGDSLSVERLCRLPVVALFVQFSQCQVARHIGRCHRHRPLVKVCRLLPAPPIAMPIPQSHKGLRGGRCHRSRCL